MASGLPVDAARAGDKEFEKFIGRTLALVGGGSGTLTWVGRALSAAQGERVLAAAEGDARAAAAASELLAQKRSLFMYVKPGDAPATAPHFYAVAVVGGNALKLVPIASKYITTDHLVGGFPTLAPDVKDNHVVVAGKYPVMTLPPEEFERQTSKKRPNPPHPPRPPRAIASPKQKPHHPDDPWAAPAPFPDNIPSNSAHGLLAEMVADAGKDGYVHNPVNVADILPAAWTDLLASVRTTAPDPLAQIKGSGVTADFLRANVLALVAHHADLLVAARIPPKTDQQERARTLFSK
jgi:hypothetical protein